MRAVPVVVLCLLSCCRVVEAQGTVPDHVRQEIDSAITQFHVNRTLKQPYAVRVIGDYTFIDRHKPNDSRYVQLNMIVSSLPARPMEHAAYIRTDYNVDRLVEGQSQPSMYWFTRLSRGSKRFYNVNSAWTEIPPDSKAVIPGMTFDLWSITACQFGDFARNKVGESYFDLVTQSGQLIDASLEPRHIIATWLVSPRKDAKATIRFDRTSKMPVHAQWHAKVEKRINGVMEENWFELGNTATQWKRIGMSQWVPGKVSIVRSAGQPSQRTYQWDLEFDWTIGKAIQEEWFDPEVAPDGSVLSQILQL
jgi:hypothetical protein